MKIKLLTKDKFNRMITVVNTSELNPNTVIMTNSLSEPLFINPENGEFCVAVKFAVEAREIVCSEHRINDEPVYSYSTVRDVINRQNQVGTKVQEEITSVNCMTQQKAYRIYLQNPKVKIPYTLIKEIDTEIEIVAKSGHCSLRFDLFKHESTYDERKEAVYHYTRNGFKVVKCMDYSFIHIVW